MRHTPVLVQETIALLAPQPGEIFIDATLGAGGHARALLEHLGPTGKLLGLDRDNTALTTTKKELTDRRMTTVHGSFEHLQPIANGQGFSEVDGILFDLGLSSMELADAQRGFSFQVNGPLDMRFDQCHDTTTAADLVNRLSLAQLRSILVRYGEETHAGRIASAIVQRRKKQTISTTHHLLLAVLDAVRTTRSRIHPATRTFQALRIAVNRELEALTAVLPQAVNLLKPGGRLVIISFHSLEDRIAKQYFRRESHGCVCPPEFPICTCGHQASIALLTTKPITPSADEIRANPRSRSAKLRGIKKRNSV